MQLRSRDTRTIPYTHWGCECQSERAPALGERYGSHSEAEWENEGSRGRPKADQRVSWGLYNWGRDEQTNQLRVWENAESWALNQVSWQGKHDYFCSARQFFGRDCHFVEESVSFERRSNNDPPNVEQRYLELLVSGLDKREKVSCKITVERLRAIKIRFWRWYCSEIQLLSLWGWGWGEGEGVRVWVCVCECFIWSEIMIIGKSTISPDFQSLSRSSLSSLLVVLCSAGLIDDQGSIFVFRT